MAQRIPNINVPNARQLQTIVVPDLPRGRVVSQRLPSLPVVRELPKPVTAPMPPPATAGLKAPALNVPAADVPTYTPPTTVPPDPDDVVEPQAPNIGAGNTNESGENEGDGGAEDRELPNGAPIPGAPSVPAQPVIDVPYIGEVPVPPYETVVLSGTTAVATVAATLIGKEVATQLLSWMKPVVKQIMLKLKKALKGDLTPYETQELMLFEGQKKLTKRLKAEQKAEKLRQASVHQAPLRRRIQMRMEKKDGSRPQP